MAVHRLWGWSETGKTGENQLLLMNNMERIICRSDFHFMSALHFRRTGPCPLSYANMSYFQKFCYSVDYFLVASI